MDFQRVHLSAHKRKYNNNHSESGPEKRNVREKNSKTRAEITTDRYLFRAIRGMKSSKWLIFVHRTTKFDEEVIVTCTAGGEIKVKDPSTLANVRVGSRQIFSFRLTETRKNEFGRKLLFVQRNVEINLWITIGCVKKVAIWLEAATSLNLSNQLSRENDRRLIL